MDIYHIWCDLKPGTSDTEFASNVSAFLEALRGEGKICGFRITRKKLGLAPARLGQFHIMIETEDMGQLESAFRQVASRTAPVEDQHYAVNTLVENARFALYRDFPDPVRQTGDERF